MKRYQECNIIEKLWRRRWYLLVPFIFSYKVILHNHDKFDRELLWSIINSELEISKMKYYWTMEEVLKRLEKIKQKHKK